MRRDLEPFGSSRTARAVRHEKRTPLQAIRERVPWLTVVSQGITFLVPCTWPGNYDRSSVGDRPYKVVNIDRGEDYRVGAEEDEDETLFDFEDEEDEDAEAPEEEFTL